MGLMINLERKIGPMRVRAWGLIVKFCANIVALYGMALTLGGRGGTAWLVVGVTGTIACVMILSQPVRDGTENKRDETG